MIALSTPTEAMERINVLVAHAWMVRTFLKHAPEFEDDPERMEIPREIFDFARAVESRYVARDHEGYLKMVRKKLGKLRGVAERFSREQPDISNHTTFQQAVLSLTGCVAGIQEVLESLPTGPEMRASDQSERFMNPPEPGGPHSEVPASEQSSR